MTARNSHLLAEPSLASARTAEVCLRNKLHRKQHSFNASSIQFSSYLYRSIAFSVLSFAPCYRNQTRKSPSARLNTHRPAPKHVNLV